MIRTIKTSKFSKVIASYLAIQLIVATVQPSNLFALTGGPSQPEFNSFTPIGTSDMVNLSSGDFNYNIPIMDVGGYPLNLAYDSGISMDQQASWVGLGWNLNVGQINRQVRGIPDDFNGDGIKYENNLKPNKTVGMGFFLNPQLLGFETDGVGLTGSAGLMIQHNNYEGISVRPSLGLSFAMANGASVGMSLSGSSTQGATVSPSIGISKKSNNKIGNTALSAGLNIGTQYNSRQGLSSFSVNTSINHSFDKKVKNENVQVGNNSQGGSGTISFINQTFTPQKRMSYNNTGFTFNASLGFDLWGIDGEVSTTAFGMEQKINDKVKTEKSYGYEFTKNATTNDILDFNRENDNPVTKNTLVLPTVNYTYDIYNINGQGISGQYRPFKSQAGQVFDQTVIDTDGAGEISGEFEGGTGFHVGADLKYSRIKSHTTKWNTPTSNLFFTNADVNILDYEETYFKSVGDLNIDSNTNTYNNLLGEENPIALNIVSPGMTLNQFNVKEDNPITPGTIPVNDKIVSENRQKRNIAILKVTNREANTDPTVNTNLNAEEHHTVGVKILKPDGSRYVYGESAYNNTKVESTFAIDDFSNTIDYANGTSTYTGNGDNGQGLDHYFNRITTPAYAHTYLLTSVLSSDYEDLSGDGPTDDDLGAYTKFHYDNEEVNSDSYSWRVPLEGASYNPGLYTRADDQKASYVYGEKEIKYVNKIETKTHVAVFDFTERRDSYGVIPPPGPLGQSPGLSTSVKMYKINTISLFSKPDYNKLIEDYPETAFKDIPAEVRQKASIKIAHFEYNYSLCQNLPSNSGTSEMIDGEDINQDEGKLTLKSVYFTYRGSNMGRYTPYVFNYDTLNPDYQVKSYDIWGNYKPLFENSITQIDTDSDGVVDDITLGSPVLNNCEVENEITAQEFPFVQQKDKALQNLYASAWTMSSINLPSGGTIELDYESDDYQFVQDKKAMQMFKVVGASTAASPHVFDDKLYTNAGDKKYLVVELPESENASETDLEGGLFEEKYLGEHKSEPIAFKFLMNFSNHRACDYEYVTGYFKIDPVPDYDVFDDSSKRYIAIPMQWSTMEKSGGDLVNPISKAGWYFGRSYLNKYIYAGGDDYADDKSLEAIVGDLKNAFSEFFRIFDAPNKVLKDKGIASIFKPNKSWVRLQSPENKLGGGLRVSQIRMLDNWAEMTGNGSAPNRYGMEYGQEYIYALDIDGVSSSGVATFEPNMSRENPLVKPFYNGDEPGISPKEMNYVEKPFGVSFFPSPTVTYSRVIVKNLDRTNSEAPSLVLKKHATGYVINDFFTSNKFPTKADYTALDKNFSTNTGSLGTSLLTSILKLKAKTHLTASQGFSIVTNDMNGKTERQQVFDQNNNLISEVEYKYNIDEATGELNNMLPVVKADGTIEDQLIGVDYDVITDFRENYNNTNVKGVNVNVATIPFTVLTVVIPMPLFNSQRVSTTLHTTTTTKVVHKTGILKEKIAKDLGAQVSTKNIAWDASSGQVLLTETVNEYDDNYFNLSYPAYWAYDGMGQATKNLGIECWLTTTTAGPNVTLDDDPEDSAWYRFRDFSDIDMNDFFAPGDEVLVYDKNNNPINQINNRLWINEIKAAHSSSIGNQLVLTDRNGYIFNPCGDNFLHSDIKIKVVRSHRRNLQTASMASITSMVNPAEDNNKIDNYDFVFGSKDPKIINASAVEYKDFWRHQNELTKGFSNLPNLGGVIDDPAPTVGTTGFDQGIGLYPDDSELNIDNNLVNYPKYYSNPFVNNIKGDWRAVKSYAYLTGRNSDEEIIRDKGFFTSFLPFYIENSGLWEINPNAIDENNSEKWTFASKVTKYSPYGAELENEDALGRRSSAQYGYGYTLPIAVASNSDYEDMGYDGFEDYSSYVDNGQTLATHFSYFNSVSNSGIERSINESHTGKYSLKVDGGHSTYAILVKRSDTNPIGNAIPTLDCAPPDETDPPGGGGICPTTIFYFYPGVSQTICLPTQIPFTNVAGSGFGSGGCEFNQNGVVVTFSSASNGTLQICASYNGNNPTSNNFSCNYNLTFTNGDTCVQPLGVHFADI